MLRVFITLVCFLAQCQAATFCIRNERYSGRRKLSGGPTCAVRGSPSGKIYLGDDTGWTGQTIAIQYDGPGKVCMSFRATSRWLGEQSTGEKCSENGIWSQDILLGDDTGWENQNLKIIYHGTDTELCFLHGRRSKYDSAVVNTEPICSSNGIPREVGIGDDTGWLDQWMIVSVERPTAPVPARPTAPVPAAQQACYCTYFDGLPKVAHCNSCDPQLIETGVCYTSTAQGTVCAESQRACQCYGGGLPSLAYCNDCAPQQAKSGCNTISQQGTACSNVKPLSVLEVASPKAFDPIPTDLVWRPKAAIDPIPTDLVWSPKAAIDPIPTDLVWRPKAAIDPIPTDLVWRPKAASIPTDFVGVLG